MADLREISFEVTAAPDDPGGSIQIIPIIDGQSLIERVRLFEESRKFTPAGGYAGIVPANFRFGDLTKYFLGAGERQWPRPGNAWVLGCDCGEVGCWPLTARIDATDRTVTWSGFHQAHRPSWDYDGFGPFVFDRPGFDEAVRSAAESVRWAT